VKIKETPVVGTGASVESSFGAGLDALSINNNSIDYRRRQYLPPGHRFFGDCEREQIARYIDWAVSVEKDAWFTTLTFKRELSPYKAERMCDRWLARLDQAYKDKTGRRLKSFRATEWQQRGVVHYHLLVLGAGLDALSRKRWEHRWGANGGGYARIYEAERKSAPYLAKYMNKRLGGEVHIGGAWQGMNPPRALSVCCRAPKASDTWC